MKREKKEEKQKDVFFTAILIIFLLSLFDFSHLFAPKFGWLFFNGYQTKGSINIWQTPTASTYNTSVANDEIAVSNFFSGVYKKE